MATKRKFEIGDAVMVKKTGDFGMITGYSTPWYYVNGYTKYTANQLEKAGDENLKYGDRVRVIENTGTLEVGEVGTIIAKDVDGTYLFESDTSSEVKHRGHDYGIEWGRCGKMGESRCGWVFPSQVEKIVEEVKQEKTEVKDNFKMGDRVVCKTKNAFGFSVGETGTVIAKMLENDDYYLIRHDAPNQWCHTGSMGVYDWGEHSDENDCTYEYEKDFKLLKETPKNKEEIHITRKGKEVHAILKKDGKLVKRTVAKCHPSDEFDFETGAKLAMSRLYGAVDEQKNELHSNIEPSKYKVGDMVLLKTKEEIIKEFGGLRKVSPVCLSPMEEFLGKPVVLKDPNEQLYNMETFTTKDLKGLAISDQYIKGKIVKCDEYKEGDKVLVKSEKQVVSEKLLDVFPHFVWLMRKYCDKVITLGEKMPDEAFLYEGFWWGKDFFVGKVVK